MTPRPTRVALVGVLGATAVVLAYFEAAPERHAQAVLALLTALFFVRVTGQIVARVAQPTWLPPTAEWNLVPYRVLLPAQLVILAVMARLCVDPHAGAVAAVPVSFVYAGAIALRYAVRMRRRPEQRWFGGTIPIVFHVVLASFLFVVGSSSG